MARNKRSNSTRASEEVSATRGNRKRQEAPASATPTLNERLRRKGRWVFAALVVVFALSFVIAGVGTSGPSMLDLLGQNNGSDAPVTSGSETAVQEAKAKTVAAPKDPQAWIALAQAYVNTGETSKAPEVLQKAAALAPKDVAVQTTIADVYLALAGSALQRAQTEYAAAQSGGTINGLAAVPQTIVPGGSNGVTAFQTAQESIANAQLQALNTLVTRLQTEATDAYIAAVEAEKIVTELTPLDPAAWFRLGQISTAANDAPGAIAAYQRFVKLAPEDPLTQKLKDEIARLMEESTGADHTETGADHID